MIEIQTILDTTKTCMKNGYKSEYYKRENDIVKKISKSVYIKLYDQAWTDSDIIVLPSLTRE